MSQRRPDRRASSRPLSTGNGCELEPEEREAIETLRRIPGTPWPSPFEVGVLIFMLVSGVALMIWAFLAYCPIRGTIGGLLAGFSLGALLLIPHQVRLLRTYRLLTRILRAESRDVPPSGASNGGRRSG